MIKPLRGYCLLEVEKAEEQTSSGIYLPERSQEKPAKGKIIAIGLPTYQGNDQVSTMVEVHKDDIVYFKKWGGETIKEDGKEYVFVKFEDLLAVVEE